MKDYKLCYIDGPWAFFTTQPLDKQWGDDWNDVPYEHNAGRPYEPRKDGDSWEISKVAFDCDDLDQPSDQHCNSPYSVQDINAHAVAWLTPNKWAPKGSEPIRAGASVAEFKALVIRAGGEVYERGE